jgi:hypothetical protein
MDLLTVSHLPFSAERGWPELARIRPGLRRVFTSLVLPMSLVPPAMLYLAGTRHPEMFPGQVGPRPWGQIAAVFFVAELASYLAMGWFIRQVAATSHLELDDHDAYLLAALAPVPMWLSSLGLLIPNLLASGLVALVGLGLSCGVTYHGVLALCRTREDVVAEGIVQTVIGAGVIAWAALVLIALA